MKKFVVFVLCFYVVVAGRLGKKRPNTPRFNKTRKNLRDQPVAYHRAPPFNNDKEANPLIYKKEAANHPRSPVWGQVNSQQTLSSQNVNRNEEASIEDTFFEPGKSAHDYGIHSGSPVFEWNGSLDLEIEKLKEERNNQTITFQSPESILDAVVDEAQRPIVNITDGDKKSQPDPDFDVIIKNSTFVDAVTLAVIKVLSELSKNSEKFPFHEGESEIAAESNSLMYDIKSLLDMVETADRLMDGDRKWVCSAVTDSFLLPHIMGHVGVDDTMAIKDMVQGMDSRREDENIEDEENDGGDDGMRNGIVSNDIREVLYAEVHQNDDDDESDDDFRDAEVHQGDDYDVSGDNVADSATGVPGIGTLKRDFLHRTNESNFLDKQMKLFMWRRLFYSFLAQLCKKDY